MNNQSSGSGGTILALGIIGLALTLIIPIIGVVCSLVAWSMGDTALRKLNTASSAESAEKGMISAGRTCGMVGSLLFLGVLILKYAVQSGR